MLVDRLRKTKKEYKNLKQAKYFRYIYQNKLTKAYFLPNMA